MSELGDAIQIIKVTWDGLDLTFRVAGATFDKLVEVATLLVGIMHKEKLMGKTRLRDMLKRGGDLQVFQFDEKNLKEFEKYAKDYGILYTKLPDINKGDGLTEVLFPTEAVPRVNLLLQKIGNGQIISITDYLDNGVPEEKKAVLGELEDISMKVEEPLKNSTKSEKKIEAPIDPNIQYDSLLEMAGHHVIESGVVDKSVMMEHFGIDEEHVEQLLSELETIGAIEKTDSGFKVCMDRNQFDEKMKKINEIRETLEAMERASNKNLVDITIDEKLIVKETDTMIKTRIPFKNDEYIWLDKKDINLINQGKTILSFLDKEKDYEIVNGKDEVVRVESGTTVFKNYDPVEHAGRLREEKKKRNEERNRNRSQHNGYRGRSNNYKKPKRTKTEASPVKVK